MRVGFDVIDFVGTIGVFVDVFIGFIELPPNIVVGSPGLPVEFDVCCIGVVVADRVDSPGEDVAIGSTFKEED